MPTPTHIARVDNTTSILPVSPMRVDWRDAVEAFLRARDVKETTRKQYRKDLMLFFAWVEGRGVEISSLSRNDIIDYRKELLEGEKRLSAQTVAAYIVAIRRFYQWAEAERISPNIANQVKSPKTRNVFIKQHLTPDECRDMTMWSIKFANGCIRTVKATGCGITPSSTFCCEQGFEPSN